jgi:hypothetical protein
MCQRSGEPGRELAGFCFDRFDRYTLSKLRAAIKQGMNCGSRIRSRNNFEDLSKWTISTRHPCEPGHQHGPPNQIASIMKYALLVHQFQEHFDRRNDADILAAGRAYGEALIAAGIFVGGAGLGSPQAATTVSVRDGKRQVHDGPYAETKEFLAGFGIIEVPDLDTALEWASRHPSAAFASIEVRPLLGSHFVSAPTPAA